MDYCTGRGTPEGDHCCWVEGVRCPFLVENVDGRRYACGLRNELGSWEAVHADPGYQELVQPVWDRVGITSCGDWQPDEGVCCRAPRDGD
jgi:hypothetical protein